MRDTFIIIRRNFLQPIVIAVLILSLILFSLEQAQDAWFISAVIIVNTLLAIVQELRARKALKKLELMSAPRANRMLPNGSIEEVKFDELRTGDMVHLVSGDEVPADGRLLTSVGLEVNEGMLTGESTAVDKSTESIVYASTIVVAGEAIMRVEAIGDQTKVGIITATLKKYSPRPTPLQRAIALAITILTYGAVGLAALIFVVYWFMGLDALSTVRTITAAAITVVPEGLLLASSLLLAFGSLRLAQASVLPQKLGAIEAMALLDTLCVDKTGTLTTDRVYFEDVQLWVDGAKDHWRRYIGMMARETGADNTTSVAIATALPGLKNYTVIDRLAFSSSRKMSAVRFQEDENIHTLVMGAPEYVERLAPLSAKQRAQIVRLTSQGRRILLVASCPSQTTDLKQLEAKSGLAVGFVILSNPLRNGVKDTIAYLQANQVNVRVISGDSPATVGYIAAQAGIAHANRIITGAELAGLSDAKWRSTILATTIFARVLPEQKERIVATFQTAGHFTGMVGDGVNDALALKQADLGVAMYDGAIATRRVADIVLLNNDFTSLPIGMKLGNKIMQAIEVISVLFFHKIAYSVTLLLMALVTTVDYPFLPRHVSFMNIFFVTLPTIMWAIFPPTPRRRVQPQNFWRDTLVPVLPLGLISGLAVIIVFSLGMHLTSDVGYQGVLTTTVGVAIFFGVHLVFLAPKVLGLADTRAAVIARYTYLAVVIVIAYWTYSSEIIREFFGFTAFHPSYIIPTVAVVVTAAVTQQIIARRSGTKLRNI